MISTFLGKLWQRKQSPARRPKRKPTPKTAYRPGLDLLEDRTMLSATTVLPAGAALASSDTPSTAHLNELYGQTPLSFEANQGQSDSRVLFLAHGQGYGLFLTKDAAVLQLQNADQGLTDVLQIRLVDANASAAISGQNRLPGVANYYIGNDPSQWHDNIPTFGGVTYSQVYNGVDLVYYGNQRQLEYDFVVNPGADPHAIKLSFDGATSMALDDHGNLVLHAPGGDVVQQAPVIYQEVNGVRQSVPGAFELLGDHQVGFSIGAYDSSLPIIIDPVLTYATYLGGSMNDTGNSIAIDNLGNAYITGSTVSANFPVANAIQPQFGDTINSDAFVTKLTANGKGVVYSTYMGGIFPDVGNAIAADSTGNAYIAGTTRSINFPTSAGSLQATFVGVSDAFAAKLTASGTRVYSTFLGGLGVDEAYGIALDNLNQAYVTGVTFSASFQKGSLPVTPTKIGPGGNGDIYVALVNSAGSDLVYLTYVGGKGLDQSTSITVDPNSNAYFTGFTDSTDFPTVSAFQAANAGNRDAVVSKLDNKGASLVYSSYLGGSTNDVGNGIALDPANNAYIGGTTDSAGDSKGAGKFPITSGVFQSTLGGNADAFVTKVNSAGSAILFSTFLGGLGTDLGSSIAVDTFGNAYLIGQTDSFNFPTTSDALPTNRGQRDAFVSEFNSVGIKLLYSTLLGGTQDDTAADIVTDSTGNVYVTGSTGNLFPVTTGSFQTTYGGGSTDAYVAEISGLPVPQFHLVFGQQPTDTLFNAIISPAVTVTVQDQNNKIVTGDNASQVTLAIQANPAGNGILSGTLTVTAVNGVATFRNLSIDKVGVGYTLAATNPSGFPGDVSNPFDIVKPVKVEFQQQPTNTNQGATITPAVTVAIKDANNQIVTADNTDKVTLSIGTNPGGGSLAGTVTVTAVRGIATFSNLSIDQAGKGYTLVAGSPGLLSNTSSTFNINSTVQIPTSLAFKTQPTKTASGIAIVPPVQVNILDANGSVVTGDNSTVVTMAIGTNPGGGTLSGTISVAAVNGVATFNNLKIDKAGTGYTLRATAPGLAPATSNPFEIFTPAPADRLAFVQQPTDTSAGNTITPAVSVQVLDANGQLITSDNTRQITLAIGTNPGGGQLSGTATATVVGGIATFNNLSINKAGNGYTLVATTPNLKSATSNPFNILPGPVTHFGMQVADSITDGCSTVTLTVSALDKFDGINNGYRGTVHFTSSDPLAGLPRDYAFTGADSGKHTFTLTLQTVGLQSVTANDRSSPSINGTGIVQVINDRPFTVYATAADAGGGPNVKVIDAATGTVNFDFFAYDQAYSGGVRIAMGDVFRHGYADIITGPGPGGGPDIHVYDGQTGQLRYQFFAFDIGFTGGVYVAAGDVNADGYADIIVGADSGGGPNVNVFSGKDLSLLMTFFPYDINFTGGVRVAAGDVNGDRFSDVICGAGPGGGPNVTVISGRTGKSLSSFFAYDPGFTAGIYVTSIAATDDPCGFVHIATGPGLGGGPNVRVFDGLTTSILLNFSAEAIGNFNLASDPRLGVSGVRVASVWKGAGVAPSIVASFGQGHEPTIVTFDPITGEQVDSFFAYNPLFDGGVFIGNGAR